MPATLVRATLVSATLLAFATGCGGPSPQANPGFPTDGGIPDRIILEGGAGNRGDSGVTEGGSDGDGGLAGDGAGAGGDAMGGDVMGGDAMGGGGDNRPTDVTVTVTVTDPPEGTLEIAARRFAPLVSVVVASDAAGGEDVKRVDAELWSIGAAASMLSTTPLTLLSKIAADANAAAADASPPSDDAGADGPGATGGASTTFSFGDTPIDLSTLGTGTYELHILATTVTGATASATRRFRADAGPIIRVIAPIADQASRGSVFVNIEVTDPFSVSPPTVSVSVANIPIAPLTISGTLYQATVAETITSPPLSGEQLLDVGATNAAGVSARHVVVKFVFDDVGPTIANAKPAVGSLIGGVIKIEADVTDPANVDANSVTAVVAHGGSTLEVKLDQDPITLKHFSHLFDTRRLANSVLYPTISFRASDVPGNQSTIGYTVAVDNTPPVAELDPPADLRVRRKVNGTWRCSWQFDPLGTDAVNDGDLVFQLFDVRARVEDDGNTPAAGGADIIPLAGLDPAHVELLVLDDTNRALVVDNDGDGVCDAINPKLIPTTTPMSSQDALLINMSTVPATGSADFTFDPSIGAAGLADCSAGADSIPPEPLCRTSDLTIAIPSGEGTVGAIWTIPNVVPGTVQCVGNQFDSLGNQLRDGPACLAVRAVDRLGNTQVSRVLHVCVDHDGVGGECPFAPVTSVAGGSPVLVTTPTPHALTTGDRVLVGAVPILFDANGLWRVTVVSSTSFTLDGSNTPGTSVTAGRFMRWTGASDCTGRQTSLSPVVVDDTQACTPWRRYTRGEHLDIP